MIFLDAETVNGLHEHIVATQPCRAGDFGIGRLEAVLGRVENLIEYDSISYLFEIAAAGIYCIAKGHAFIDGNKRTALLSGSSFLELNHRPILVNDNFDNYLVDLVTDDMNLVEFSIVLCDARIEYERQLL